MSITLQPVTRDNIEAICRLRVADDQQEFVASNVGSIAEAYVEPTYCPFAIYAGDDPVGFTMYGDEDPPGRWWIVRLMIDQRHQGRGYGRQAMEALIPLMIERHAMEEIVTSFVPGNDVAARLYRSIGFVETGEIDEDEHVMHLDVPTWRARSPSPTPTG